jgi:hypothetical protein
MYRVARNVTPKMIVLGDVPRHDSEGVVAIMASEHFGRLESKIMGFPGSEHVSSPRVLANAGQAATIEIGGMKGATGEAWTKATFLSELGKGHMHKVSLSWSVVGSTAALDYSAWVPEGRTIMLMQPAGERGDGSWHVLVATPRVLRGIDEE